MFSTRVRLTTTFVVALCALTVALFLSFLTARNASIYRDIGESAATKAELAAQVLRQGLSLGQSVVVAGDSTVMPTLAPRITTFLDALPGFLLAVDTHGRVVYKSPEVRAL